MKPEHLKILLIEDDPLDAEIVQARLTRAALPFTIERAVCLNEAIDLLSNNSFDVVLLDLGLPDSSELATFTAIHEKFPHLPVVILSGSDDEELVLRAMRAGAQDYIVKGKIKGTVLWRILRHAIEREHLQNRLEASEKRFRALIENSADGISLLDAQGTILYESAACARIFGTQPGDRTGLKFFDWIHLQDLERCTAHFWGTPAQNAIQFRCRDAQGEWIWLEATVQNRLADAEVRGLVVNFRDISAQKAAEAEREHTERLYRTLAANFPNGNVYLLDRDSRILLVDGRGLQKIGLQREEMIGKTLAQVYAGTSAYDAVMDAFAKALAGQEVATEAELRGSWRAIRAVPVRDENDEVIAVTAMTQDITAQKQIEANLRESQKRLQMALATARMGVWEWNLTNDEVYWSPECYAIFGDPNFGSDLQSFVKLLHPDDADSVVQTVRGAIENHEVYEAEFRIVRADGQILWLSNFGRAEYDEAGLPLRMVGTVRDVTRRRKTREVLRASESRFRDLLSSAGEGIYGLDHQGCVTFVNPVAAQMLGYSEDELRGRHLHSTIHHSHVNGTPFALEDYPVQLTLRHGETQRIDDDIFWRKDGTPLPVAYISTPMRDAETGALQGAVVTFRDLTEQKKAEAELHAVLTNARCILWHADVWDEHRETRSGRDAQADLLWKTHIQDEKAAQQVLPLELRGDAPYEFLWTQSRHPDDGFRINTNARQAILQGEAGYTQEFRCLDKNGQWHWLLEDAVIVPLEAGHWQVYGVATDITALKQATEELREREALLRETGHIAKVGGWSFDVATRQGVWTEEVARIHDLDPALPTSVEGGIQYYVGESRQRIEEAVDAAIEQGLPYDLELEMVSALGNHKWVRTIGHPEIVGGAVTRVWGSFQDITERKQIEAAREKQQRRVALLANISERLLFSEQPDEILEEIFTSVAREVGAEIFFHYAVCGNDTLQLKNCGGLTAQQRAAFAELTFADGICGLTAQRGEPHILQDVQKDDRPRAAAIRAMGVCAYACHPLMSGRIVLGTLAFACTTRTKFDDDEVRLMKTVCDQVTEALERTRLLNEVRDNEARLRRILSAFPVAAYTCDAEGLLTFYNEQAAVLWGRKPALKNPEKRFGGSFKLFRGDGVPLRPEDSCVALALRENVSQHDKEIIIERENGTRSNVLAFIEPLRDASGAVNGVVNVMLDITERKRTEEEMRLVLTNARCMLWSGEVEGLPGWEQAPSDQPLLQWRLTMHNEQTAQLVMPLEVRPGDQYFQVWADSRLPADKLLCSMNAVKALLHGDDHVVQEFRCADKHGAVHWLHEDFTIQPIARNRWRVFGIVTDISSLKEAEQELQRLNDELEERVQRRTEQLAKTNESLQVESSERQMALGALREAVTQVESAKEEAEAARAEAERANRAKSEFLSRMSHELRTPMNSILGFAQLMEMSAINEREADHVGHILKSGQHLLKLINEVLDIARVESGHLSLSPEALEISGALQTAIDIIRPLCQQRDLTLIYDRSQAVNRFVHADQQRLSQVLINLLSNAVKYNRAGGEVRVQCLPIEGDKVRISISDTGKGIKPENRERLFQPFDRLGAESTGIEGTGLGLSLTKHLLEAMGSTIGVESTPDVGSHFFFDLELTADPVAQAHTGPAFTGRPGKTLGEHVVLYIEDNLANLQVIEHILARYEGIRLISAMQGSIGLELAREHRPSLILLDLHLPDMQGDEVLKRLLADPLTCEVPVVIVSADATPNQVSRLLLRGATDYMTKPIDVRRFLELVHGLLK